MCTPRERGPPPCAKHYDMSGVAHQVPTRIAGNVIPASAQQQGTHDDGRVTAGARHVEASESAPSLVQHTTPEDTLHVDGTTGDEEHQLVFPITSAPVTVGPATSSLRKQALSAQSELARIQVVVRIRPTHDPTASRTTKALPDGKTLRLQTAPPKGSKKPLDQRRVRKDSRCNKELEISLDRVLDEGSRQGEVYDQVKSCVLAPFHGVNACIFAYGQTGSGKTYTMTGGNHTVSSSNTIAAESQQQQQQQYQQQQQLRQQQSEYATVSKDVAMRSQQQEPKDSPQNERADDLACATLNEHHGHQGGDLTTLVDNDDTREDDGIIPRAVQDVFRHARKHQGRNYFFDDIAPETAESPQYHRGQRLGSSAATDDDPHITQGAFLASEASKEGGSSGDTLKLTGDPRTASAMGAPGNYPADKNANTEARIKSTSGPRVGIVGELQQRQCAVEFSYMEVYNGRVYDLLAVDNNCGLLRPLPVRHSTADATHDPVDNPESAAASEDDFPSSNSGRAARRHSVSNGDGVCVVGLSSHRVEGSQQVMKLLLQGEQRRRVRATEPNATSSRSHTIVELTITKTISARTAYTSGRQADNSGTQAAECPVHRTSTHNCCFAGGASCDRCDGASSRPTCGFSNSSADGSCGEPGEVIASGTPTTGGDDESQTRPAGAKYDFGVVNKAEERSGKDFGDRSSGGSPSQESMTTRAKLSLVDLAGSEKGDGGGAAAWHRCSEAEEQERERAKINSSLSALSNCISCLGEAGRRHVPFRDNSLTRLLQDPLSRGKTVVIATINPSRETQEESISTLNFAARCMRVTVRQRVHEVTSDAVLLHRARRQISLLRRRLRDLEIGSSSSFQPKRVLLGGARAKSIGSTACPASEDTNSDHLSADHRSTTGSTRTATKQKRAREEEGDAVDGGGGDIDGDESGSSSGDDGGDGGDAGVVDVGGDGDGNGDGGDTTSTCFKSCVKRRFTSGAKRIRGSAQSTGSDADKEKSLLNRHCRGRGGSRGGVSRGGSAVRRMNHGRNIALVHRGEVEHNGEGLATAALIERFSSREEELLRELEAWKTRCLCVQEEISDNADSLDVVGKSSFREQKHCVLESPGNDERIGDGSPAAVDEAPSNTLSDRTCPSCTVNNCTTTASAAPTSPRTSGQRKIDGESSCSWAKSCCNQVVDHLTGSSSGSSRHEMSRIDTRDDDKGGEYCQRGESDRVRPVLESGGAWVLVLYDLNGEQEGDLDLSSGDTVEVLSRRPDGWWYGRSQTSGYMGLFPSNFVELIDEAELRSLSSEVLVLKETLPAGSESSDPIPSTYRTPKPGHCSVTGRHGTNSDADESRSSRSPTELSVTDREFESGREINASRIPGTNDGCGSRPAVGRVASRAVGEAGGVADAGGHRADNISGGYLPVLSTFPGGDSVPSSGHNLKDHPSLSPDVAFEGGKKCQSVAGFAGQWPFEETILQREDGELRSCSGSSPRDRRSRSPSSDEEDSASARLISFSSVDTSVHHERPTGLPQEDCSPTRPCSSSTDSRIQSDDHDVEIVRGEFGQKTQRIRGASAHTRNPYGAIDAESGSFHATRRVEGGTTSKMSDRDNPCTSPKGGIALPKPTETSITATVSAFQAENQGRENPAPPFHPRDCQNPSSPTAVIDAPTFHSKELEGNGNGGHGCRQHGIPSCVLCAGTTAASGGRRLYSFPNTAWASRSAIGQTGYSTDTTNPTSASRREEGTTLSSSPTIATGTFTPKDKDQHRHYRPKIPNNVTEINAPVAVASDLCERHLLPDCILCKMRKSGHPLGRSTSLPALEHGAGNQDAAASFPPTTPAVNPTSGCEHSHEGRYPSSGHQQDSPCCKRHNLPGCLLCRGSNRPSKVIICRSPAAVTCASERERSLPTEAHPKSFSPAQILSRVHKSSASSPQLSFTDSRAAGISSVWSMSDGSGILQGNTNESRPSHVNAGFVNYSPPADAVYSSSPITRVGRPVHDAARGGPQSFGNANTSSLLPTAAYTVPPVDGYQCTQRSHNTENHGVTSEVSRHLHQYSTIATHRLTGGGGGGVWSGSEAPTVQSAIVTNVGGHLGQCCDPFTGKEDLRETVFRAKKNRQGGDSITTTTTTTATGRPAGRAARGAVGRKSFTNGPQASKNDRASSRFTDGQPSKVIVDDGSRLGRNRTVAALPVERRWRRDGGALADTVVSRVRARYKGGGSVGATVLAWPRRR